MTVNTVLVRDRGAISLRPLPHVKEAVRVLAAVDGVSMSVWVERQLTPIIEAELRKIGNLPLKSTETEANHAA